MKSNTTNPFKKLFNAGLLAGAFALAASSEAAIVGPYSPDANTLHLWHMDQTTAPVIDSAVGGTNLAGLLNGATLGNASFTGFGSGLSTIDGGQDGTANRDALLTVANPLGNVAVTYADATSGAFTIEALVWIGFDPAKNLGTTANGGNNRNSTLQILSGESGTTANRIFQFRIVPVGVVPVGSTPTSVPLLTFENIRAGVSAQPTIYAAIPTNGPDAIVSNNWYHVAVTYNGVPNTASNIKLYWTLLDPSRTAANQIAITSAQTTLSGMNPLSTASTPLVIGNEARNRTGNFLGMIDEVRISKVERTSVGMIFAPANVNIVSSPTSQFVPVGDTVTLTTVAGGAQPIFYQWQFNGANLPNATNTSLVLSNISTGQAGNYQVVVSNLTSSAISAVANVRVGQSFKELFNTGVADNRSLLSGGAVDLHWQLVQSDDPAYPGPVTIVDTAPPAAWLANGPGSLWISPGDGANNAAGFYTYRTSFLIDTMDPNNAQLSGSWVSDNQGVDVRLNGVSLGITNSTALGTFSFFTLTNGFLPGSNTLECVVSNNAGGGINFSGLRVELKGVGLALPATAPALVTTPMNVTTQSQQSATFEVTATGSGSLSYQWFFGVTPLSGQTNRTLTLTGLTPAQSGNYKVVVSNGVGSTNATGTLTVTTPPLLAWLGFNSSDWDTATVNWLDTGSSANVLFSPNVDVLFDNRGSGAPVVNLAEQLQPNSVVVNADNDYTFTSFSGTGGIVGSVNLTKDGAGTLILDTTNSYTGTTLIKSGKLQVGNGVITGTLGSGVVSNNAALVFNRLDNFQVPNTISGTGSVTMAGIGGLILTGNNNYSGPTIISSGVVNLRKSTGLGTTDSGTTVADGAQLFIDANVDVAAESLVLNGSGPFGDGSLHKGGGGTTTFGGPITLGNSATIKLDGNATLNLTNAAGISGPGLNLSLVGDGGSRGTVSGSITLGAGSVSDSGAGTWVLAGTNNSWAGGTTIGGTLQIGDGGNNGSIGNGPIQLDGTLTVLSSNNISISAPISGAGALNQSGNGTLFVTGINSSYSGPVKVSGTGALRPSDGLSLGSGTITIGGSQTDTSRLELVGNITMANPIAIFPRAFGSLDNPADIVNVSGTNVVNAPTSIVIPGGGNLLTLQSDSGLMIMSNGVTATGVGRVMVLKGAAKGEIYGAIDQTGANSQLLYKLDAGTWTLFGQDTSSGTTTISNGTLVINGSLGTNVTTVAGGTLGGSGVIMGPVVVMAGGNLAPGTGIGTMTISNSLTLQSGSTISVEINKSAAVSDEVVGITNLIYGGTLVVSNLSGTLAVGDSFKLFDAQSYSGAFANIVPATPGTGLAWNTSTLATDGTLRVAVSTPAQTPKFTSVAFIGGNQIVFNGTNGNASAQFTILTSTNVADPLSAWVPVSTNNFNGSGSFTVTNTINPAAGSRFYTIRVP